MIPAIYLTPASISYLNQFLLALVITVYLGWRFLLPKQSKTRLADRLLVFFFTTVTIFSLALFLDVSLLPAQRLIVVYLQNSILALMLIALIQFAYFYPAPLSKSRYESWFALIVSLAYFAWEANYAINRFSLLREAVVNFRPPYADYVPAALFAWVIIVFFRGALKDWSNPASRRFALIFIIPLILAFLNILRSFALVSTPVYHISVSIGILITIFLFAFNYLVSQPESTSLLVKFSGTILTLVLAVLGVVAWLVTPLYVDQYRLAVVDHRTIRFIPNDIGGYDVTQVPFYFDAELGQKLALTDTPNEEGGFAVADFTFPFYGQEYSQVFITDNGLLSFDQLARFWHLEYRLSTAPIFFALGLDLNPETNPGGGIYLREEADQLIVTYDHIRAYYYPEREYTFQVVLYSNGQVDLTYNGLPPGPQYQVNDRPDASIWVIGAKPGLATGETVNLAQLPLSSSPQGVLDDQYRAFREYVHVFLLPLAIAILSSSLLFLFGLPMLLNYAMAQPLRRLLVGVERFNQDRRHQPIPIQFNDEVGFLTQSFNTLTSELDALIQTLETRVADRTADLLAANTELRKLSIAVEQSPSTIIITNPMAEIEYVNPAFTHSTGYTFEEVKGKNPRFLQSGQTPAETFKQLWDALSAGKTWRGEFINQRKNGEIFWEYTVIAPIQDENGEITHYVAVKEDISVRKAAEMELERLATTDPLTGLRNRRSFFAEAERIFARSRFEPYELAVLMLDIDHFKNVNDHYGHQAGDAVLVEVANRLVESLRPTDIVARYGGEEFIAMLPRLPAAGLAQVANRLNEAVRAPVLYNGIRIYVTFSIGAAMLTKDSVSLDHLLTRADQAMFQAKEKGRDCWVLWQG